MSKITHAQFSTQASFMASEAATWAADVLTLPEHYDDPMRDWSVERFLTNMRARLDRIEAWSKEPAPGISTQQDKDKTP